jgi:hypothetical protein
MAKKNNIQEGSHLMKISLGLGISPISIPKIKDGQSSQQQLDTMKS